jgi:proteasome lid subunit RPN8/RPN11
MTGLQPSASGQLCRRSALIAERCSLPGITPLWACSIQQAPSAHSNCLHVDCPFPVICPGSQDRVEASPEQMARCSAKAERFSAETGTLTRVVGWYHSHPHITVLPSHIDVRTQAMYQMLDPSFIGLIISTFNEASRAAHMSDQYIVSSRRWSVCSCRNHECL